VAEFNTYEFKIRFLVSNIIPKATGEYRL